MNSKRTATITAFLCIIIAVGTLASVSAVGASLSLTNWTLNSAWNHRDFVDGIWNFSYTVNLNSVVLTNATNNGKFVFGIANASATGFQFEVIPIAHEAGDYLRAGNDVHLIVLDEGTPTTVYDKYLANASSVKLTYTTATELYEFYINGYKVYQNNIVGASLTKAEWFTANVPNPVGDITEPSCFTGTVGLSVSSNDGATGGVSFDTSSMTTVLTDMLPLIMSIMTISIVVGIVAFIPKMLKNIRF